MRSFLCCAAGCLLVVVASGCGSSADSLMKKQIAGMNELADAIESGASEEKIKEITERMEANGKKLDELKLSDEEKKELTEKYKDEIRKAAGRMLSAAMSKGKMGIGAGMPKGFPGFGPTTSGNQSASGKRHESAIDGKRNDSASGPPKESPFGKRPDTPK